MTVVTGHSHSYSADDGSYLLFRDSDYATDQASICSAMESDDAVGVAIFGTYGVTAWWQFGNFEFDSLIPVGATINAVTLKTQGGSLSASAYIRGRVSESDLASHTLWTGSQYPEGNFSIAITGDRSWTRADLLDGTFEVHLGAVVGDYMTAGWDYLWVEVDYTGGSPVNPEKMIV